MKYFLMYLRFSQNMYVKIHILLFIFSFGVIANVGKVNARAF